MSCELKDTSQWFDHNYWGPNGIDLSRWKGAECRRGFVSAERFATHGEQVIKRTNRNTTRKWMRSGQNKP